MDSDTKVVQDNIDYTEGDIDYIKQINSSHPNKRRKIILTPWRRTNSIINFNNYIRKFFPGSKFNNNSNKSKEIINYFEYIKNKVVIGNDDLILRINDLILMIKNQKEINTFIYNEIVRLYDHTGKILCMFYKMNHNKDNLIIKYYNDSLDIEEIKIKIC